MVSLRIFLLVLTTLVCREVGRSLPGTEPSAAFLAIMAMCLGFGLLGKFSAVEAMRFQRQTLPMPVGWRWGRFCDHRRKIEVAWMLLLPATLLCTGWGAWVNQCLLHGCPESVGLMLLFLPTVLYLVLLELTAAQMDELAGQPSRSGERTAIGSDTTDKPDSWTATWCLRIRLGDCGNLLTCLIPVLLISSCGDLLRWAVPQWRETTIAAISTSAALLVIAAGYPAWMGRWMGVQPVPSGDLSNRIAGYRQALNIRGLQVAGVPSHGRWNGAAVVGWFPGLRCLWLGDGLLQLLNERELDMVLMHEFAHVKRMHFIWRSLPIIWAVGLALGCALAVDVMLAGGTPVWMSRVACLAASVPVLVFGLGQASRSCELDADRRACDYAAQHCAWTGGELSPAAANLASALRKLTAADRSEAATWLHPSLQQRVSQLGNYLASRPVSEPIR